MEFFTLPATMRWILITSLTMLLMMAAYRYGLGTLLLPGGAGGEIMLTGILADAGVAGLLGLVACIFSWFPRWHPYRMRAGTRLFVWWFTVVAAVVICLYVTDLYWVKSYGQRLTGSHWLQRKTGGTGGRGDFPVLALVGGGLVMAVLWWYLVKWLHDVLGSLGRPGQPFIRSFWNVAVCLFFLGALFFSARTSISIKKDDLSIQRSAAVALSANPVFTFFFR